MNWLYIDFPNLQLDRFHYLKKDHVPFAIIDETLNEVVQLNHLAFSQGIRKGMGVASSIALSDNLEIAPYNEELESEQLNNIAQELYLIVSNISLDLPKGIYVDLSSMSRLYPDVKDLWLLIEKALASFHTSLRFAASHSPLSAKVLAQSGIDKLVTTKDESLSLLKPLPVSTLPIPIKVQNSLIRIGITRLKDLLSIPLKELAVRFDIGLLNCIGQLTGELKQQLIQFKPTSYFSQSVELNFEITNLSLLTLPLTKLLDRLESFLRNSNLTTQELYLSLEKNDKEFVSLKVSSAIVQTSSKKWIELINLKLEQLKVDNPVRTISLHVTALQQQKLTTLDMLSTKEGNVELPELISILQTKLGKEAVFRLEYKEEHLPEKSVRLSSDINFTTQQTMPDKPLHSIRPSLLLPKPILLKEPVRLASFPERIQTEWWSDTTITRDYFLAMNQDKQCCWVFRQPDKNWYIHGYFS